MNTNDITIRLEKKAEHRAVENLVRFYGKSGFTYARKFGIRYN